MSPSINSQLTVVNPQLMAEIQPAVDNQYMKRLREQLDSFASRFEALKDHSEMSYVLLAEDMTRKGEKIGFSITYAALHKWAHGGAISTENLEFVADYFNVDKVWLFFGEKYGPAPPWMSKKRK